MKYSSLCGIGTSMSCSPAHPFRSHHRRSREPTTQVDLSIGVPESKRPPEPEDLGVGCRATLTVCEEHGRLDVGDVRDGAVLEQLFADAAGAGAPIEAVIHFAGLKAVGESVSDPLRYWDVNVSGSRALLSAMDSHCCRTLVFSSSATLYGYPEAVPIPETTPIQPINCHA